MDTGYCNEVYQQNEDNKLVSASITLNKMSELPEIRADIQLDKTDVAVVQGRLKDCGQCPIVGQYVKLLCKKYCNEIEYYELVAETLTDLEGKYSLEVCSKEGDKFYVIVEGQPIHEVPQNRKMINNEYRPDTCMGACIGSNMVELAQIDFKAPIANIPMVKREIEKNKIQGNTHSSKVILPKSLSRGVFDNQDFTKISDYVRFY